MPFDVQCPKCGDQRQVPDEVFGKRLRCLGCRAVFRAESPDFDVVEDSQSPRPRRLRSDDDDQPTRKPRRIDPDDRPKRGQARRRSPLPLILGLVGLVLLVGGGLGAYLVFGRSSPTEYKDPNGLFTAQFPNKPKTDVSLPEPGGRIRTEDRITWATVGEAEYTVTVLGPFVPTTTIGPRWRDHQISGEVARAGRIAVGQVVDQQTRTVDGHIATQIMTFQPDGPILAGLFLASERYVLRVTVMDHVSGSSQAKRFKAAAEKFFDSIHVGSEFGPPLNEAPPQTPVEDVLAAYRDDAAAADARFKNRWLDLTGRVSDVEFIPSGMVSKVKYEVGGQTLTCSFSGNNRGSIKAGDTVAVTGQCQGLSKAKGGPARKVEFSGCHLLTPAGDIAKFPPITGPTAPSVGPGTNNTPDQRPPVIGARPSSLPETTMQPDFKLTAVAFAQEFSSDADAFNKKYANKLVELTGEVHSVSEDFGGTGLVNLKGDPEARLSVVLFRMVNREPWHRVKPGQSARMIGRCPERQIGIPMLNDCYIQAVTGDPPPTVTADELAREFADDADAADKKWEKKYIIITGRVAEVKPPHEIYGRVFVLESNPAKPAIAPIFGTIYEDRLKAVRPGQQVTILAQIIGYAEKRGEVSFMECCLLEAK